MTTVTLRLCNIPFENLEEELLECEKYARRDAILKDWVQFKFDVQECDVNARGGSRPPNKVPTSMIKDREEERLLEWEKSFEPGSMIKDREEERLLEWEKSFDPDMIKCREDWLEWEKRFYPVVIC
jgi:hypothetical protein